jgi:BexC/CtrB/KpsE family polysaccharide export inner-membrane protein
MKLNDLIKRNWLNRNFKKLFISSFKNNISFFILVILPFFLSLVYYTIISTKVYVCESKIVVKNLSESGSLSGLGTLLKTLGLVEGTSSYGNILVNYIQSRDVMLALEKDFKIKNYYSSKEWDLLKRFDPFHLDPSYENFLKFYRKFVVNAYMEPKYNIVILQTRAKDPDFAFQLNQQILKLSENFINEMNKKVYSSALSYFESRLEESRNKIKALSEKIAKFLTKTGVVSPEQQIGVLLQQTAKLQESLIYKELELSRLKILAPQNPKIKDLEREIFQLRNEINKNLSKIAGTSTSIGPQAVELEMLKAEMNLLMKELEANLSAYLQAKNQAMMQLLFVETVEAPIKPDAPTEPRVLKNLFTIFVLCFIIWALYWFITSAVKEHAE